MSLVLPLLAVVLFMAVVMGAGWWWQKRTSNGGWVDVFWTYGTGISGIGVALLGGVGAPSVRQWLVAGLVGLWSLRLGAFILLRVARGGSAHEDVRYSRLKDEWGAAYQGRMFGFMQLQGPITALLCLSVLLAATRNGPLGLLDLIGAAILLGSILGEGLADQQMAAFRANPANKGKVCDTGLWCISRHPNYFFEFLGWVAYPVIALGVTPSLVGALSLLAPVVMFAVLRFGTGVPPLEEAMLRSRGDLFRAYQSRVPLFIPFLPAGPAKATGPK